MQMYNSDIDMEGIHTRVDKVGLNGLADNPVLILLSFRENSILWLGVAMEGH